MNKYIGEPLRSGEEQSKEWNKLIDYYCGKDIISGEDFGFSENVCIYDLKEGETVNLCNITVVLNEKSNKCFIGDNITKENANSLALEKGDNVKLMFPKTGFGRRVMNDIMNNKFYTKSLIKH